MTSRPVIPALFLVCILCLPAILPGDNGGDSGTLTLERIFTAGEFSTRTFGPARWLGDGSGYTTLEDSTLKPGGKDIVRYQPRSGKREILVPAGYLIPPGAEKPLEINDYRWSRQGDRLLIFTNTRRVWRQNTRGDYWVLNLKNRHLVKLGGDAGSSTLMFAKFSPGGDRVAYVRKNNIFVQDLGDMGIRQLTHDGSKNLINGTFDWVYEEEFALRDGFSWSPDGKYISFWQLDSSGVKEFYLVNNTGSLYPKITAIPYPKPGEVNSACRVGVVGTGGGTVRWMDIPGDPRNNYIPRMEWAANSHEIVVQRLNRLQNRNQVMLCDIHTGKARVIFTDSDEAWVDVVDDFKWMKGGRAFTWLSERDGWRRAYQVSRSGASIRPVSPAGIDVISVVKIDTLGGWLYYLASPGNAAQRYLYRVRLNGGGRATRLTPADQPGSHHYQVSRDAKWAIHTHSGFDTPPTIDLVRLPGHKRIRVLEDNSELKGKFAAVDKRLVEFFQVDIGAGVELDAWFLKPPGFDPAKRYPLLFYVYGEPAGQTVLDRWRGNRDLWHRMLAQKGYLVMSVDNRGTPAPRGRTWRKIIYRQIGILASADQAAALRAIIEKFPFVDPSRVGIWGWSGGGSMSLNAIFRYPGLYHTAMSVAPVPNQRYYDSIYQERYMGLPKDNPEGFKNGSPITFAHQLQGNLLLVHGTGDDNVHYQGSEALINVLIEANKPFTMMAYPNRSHGIYEGKNTTRHLYELLTRYLLENLPPGPVK